MSGCGCCKCSCKADAWELGNEFPNRVMGNWICGAVAIGGAIGMFLELIGFLK